METGDRRASTRSSRSWQKQQREGPHLPKSESNELWKRFRAARTTIETNRKAFFAELDLVHREARNKKQELAEKAEALVSRGADGIPAYRGLLAEWKTSGRAGKKFDDALWARFKAAGDALYSAKSEIDATANEEFAENLEAKLALLAEAEPLLKETDRTKARERLTSIQARWDAIGKVPRDKVRTVEDRLRKVEAAVRKLDEDHWHSSNPERKARSRGTRQPAARRDREARSRTRCRPSQLGTPARWPAPKRHSTRARSGWTHSDPDRRRSSAADAWRPDCAYPGSPQNHAPGHAGFERAPIMAA